MNENEYAWYHVDIYKQTKKGRERVAVLYDGPSLKDARLALIDAERPASIRKGIRCYVSGTQCWRKEGSPFETHRLYQDWSVRTDL